jgi:hypothetical protein
MNSRNLPAEYIVYNVAQLASKLPNLERVCIRILSDLGSLLAAAQLAGKLSELKLGEMV